MGRKKRPRTESPTKKIIQVCGFEVERTKNFEVGVMKGCHEAFKDDPFLLHIYTRWVPDPAVNGVKKLTPITGRKQMGNCNWEHFTLRIGVISDH